MAFLSLDQIAEIQEIARRFAEHEREMATRDADNGADGAPEEGAKH